MGSISPRSRLQGMEGTHAQRTGCSLPKRPAFLAEPAGSTPCVHSCDRHLDVARPANPRMDTRRRFLYNKSQTERSGNSAICSLPITVYALLYLQNRISHHSFWYLYLNFISYLSAQKSSTKRRFIRNFSVHWVCFSHTHNFIFRFYTVTFYFYF